MKLLHCINFSFFLTTPHFCCYPWHFLCWELVSVEPQWNQWHLLPSTIQAKSISIWPGPPHRDWISQRIHRGHKLKPYAKVNLSIVRYCLQQMSLDIHRTNNNNSSKNNNTTICWALIMHYAKHSYVITFNSFKKNKVCILFFSFYQVKKQKRRKVTVSHWLKFIPPVVNCWDS